MRWASSRARKILSGLLVGCAALMCVAVPVQLAFAQTDPTDALQRALQQHQGAGDDNGVPSKPDVQVVQPAPLPLAKEAPPSPLESAYEARTGARLTQFGYDVVGVPAPLSVLQSGAAPGNYVLGQGDELVFVLRGQENATYRQR